ncbi:glycosyltransferase family 2 protein [uncultured Sphaerochaeta sp.]|uniref:glycosyltransferase family 2 protein n=1 Tax=uncultured Sphaerochaeta sp. TaxID=886478 RepID=UPI002A0A785B|nr:glycosyltransferase family 2 protein [uncultured Sphaerochaeta sp.]
MKNQMLCSVIVPAYNCEHTLVQSIESVLCQTYSNLEVLIVNDCSTDGTLQVIQTLAEQDARIRCIALASNGGVAKARNRAFAEARGTYCAFLDSDDIWVPEKLETQIALLQDGKSDFTYSSYSFIDGKGKVIGQAKMVPSSCSISDILKENFILCSTVVIKTKFCKTYAMDGAYAHEDMVYWLTLLQAGCKAVGCETVLAFYRIYNQNRSGNKAKAAKDRWIVYRRFLKLNMISSLWYFLSYTAYGIRKYSKLKKI